MSDFIFTSCSSAPCSPKIEKKGRKKSTAKSDSPALQGMTKKWRIRRTSSVHVENPSKQLLHQQSSKKMQLEDCTFNFSFSTLNPETPLEIEFNNLNLNIINLNGRERNSLSVGSSPVTPRKGTSSDLFPPKMLIKSASNPLAGTSTLLKQSSDPLEDSSEPPSPFGSPSPSPVDGLLERVETYPLRQTVSLPPVTVLLKSIDDRFCDSCTCSNHSYCSKPTSTYHHFQQPTVHNDIQQSWNQHFLK